MKTYCECGAEIDPERMLKLEPMEKVYRMKCGECGRKYHVKIVIQNW